MHVIADGLEVPIPAAVHDQGFVAPGEEVPDKSVAAIEAAGVGPQQPFHSRDEVALRRLDHQVEVISHQATGLNLPAGPGAGCAQGRDESPAIGGVTKDRLAAISAVEHMIDGPAVFEAKPAGHP